MNSTLIAKLIFINIIVFIMWMLSPLAGLIEFMASNFLVSWDLLAEGRYWVIITSAFSHNMLFHLLINMFVLGNFGPIVLDALGARRFLVFYLIAGMRGVIF